MLTYTGRRDLYGTLSTDTSSANKTTGDVLINQFEQQILNMKPWDFKERTRTTVTVAGTQFHDLFADCQRLTNITVTVGSNVYTPKEITNRKQWDLINSSSYQSDIPEYYFVFNGQVGLFPTPATSDLVVTHHYKRRQKQLTIADFTTGTITTTTNGGTSIVGSGTSWTSKMAGCWIRITDSFTTNTGDGEWYEIESVTNSTTLVLAKAYLGASIAAGSAAYLIGQVSILPEDYQILPVYRALEVYYTSVKKEPKQAELYKVLYKEGMADLSLAHSNKSTDVMINDEEVPIDNPNLTIHA